MKLRATVATLAAAFLATGCYTVRFQSDLAPGGAKFEEKGNFFLWGLVGEKEVDLKKLCPAGPSRWQNQQTFVDGLLGVITIGIYIPRTINVECTGAKATQSPAGGDFLSQYPIAGAAETGGLR
jgi:hypothetical protein